MNILILSIGSNPMPNFIVPGYLLSNKRDKYERESVLPKPDKIMFVYSTQTAPFKNLIVKQLNFDDNKVLNINLEDNQRKYDLIKKRVLDKLYELKKENNISSIHLNYTGGTKPMAVGISSAVEKFTKCNKKIYSDLSPSKLTLTLRNGDEYPINGTMADFVKLTIEELYELHDLQKPDPEKLKKKNSELYSEEFIKFLFNKNGGYKSGDKDFYDKWYLLPTTSKSYKARKELRKKSEKYQIMEEDELNDELELLKYYLKESISKYYQIEISGDWKFISAFVSGIWLEEYLLSVILEIKDECKLTDLAWNIETKIAGRKFELDVIAIKGCETFVFSCTTDFSSGLCKSKAFEVFYRSNQIGGEVSKSILVCMADNFGSGSNSRVVDDIDIDMSQFDANKNFYILGSEDIRDKKNFKEKLISIFEGE